MNNKKYCLNYNFTYISHILFSSELIELDSATTSICERVASGLVFYYGFSAVYLHSSFVDCFS